MARRAYSEAQRAMLERVFTTKRTEHTEVCGDTIHHFFVVFVICVAEQVLSIVVRFVVPIL